MNEFMSYPDGRSIVNVFIIKGHPSIVSTYENTSTVILNIININFGTRYLLKKKLDYMTV